MSSLAFAQQPSRSAQHKPRRHIAAVAVALSLTAISHVQAAAVSGRGTWETTLKGRDLDGNLANGFEAYYDTALDITWLADANYAKTSGYDQYDKDGRINWNDAMAWTASLNIGGVTGWRLPTLVDTGTPGCNVGSYGTDCGYNVDTSSSELAHMYHVTLGNLAYADENSQPRADSGLKNTGPFSNVEAYYYWTGTEYAPRKALAWDFQFNNGVQVNANKSVNDLLVWVVHSGDVGSVTPSIPEPQTYAMALVGVVMVSLLSLRNRT
jgi:hypothetical protein